MHKPYSVRLDSRYSRMKNKSVVIISNTTAHGVYDSSYYCSCCGSLLLYHEATKSASASARQTPSQQKHLKSSISSTSTSSSSLPSTAAVVIKLRKSRCRSSLTSSLLLLAVVFNSFGYYAECHGGFTLSEEKRLIKQLIDNYTIDGKFGRPIKAMNATLKVGYGISLVQIMDVDEKDQVLTTNVWCKYKWRDESLHWVAEEHDNITIVRVPINTIWKPDFVLYNYADERLSEHRSTMALIDPDGYVTWIPPAIFKSTCFVDTTYFPFDEQSCHMKFGSWTYNGNALDPFFIDDKEYIELSEYVPSQEWVILEHWAQKNIAFYECCPNEPYPDLTFYLKLRRRATFYSYTLILPCVLLSFITMVLFMLPPETPAKMLLGINIFAAFSMLLLLLKDSTPPTAKQIPIIGAYYCFNMVMATCSTFLCAILVDMHFRADKRNPPGRWLTYIVLEIVAKSMFMYIPPSMVTLQQTQRLEYLRKKRLAAKLKSNTPLGASRKRSAGQKEPRSSCVEDLCDCVVVKAPPQHVKVPEVCSQISAHGSINKIPIALNNDGEQQVGCELDAANLCGSSLDHEEIFRLDLENVVYSGAVNPSCLGCQSGKFKQEEEPLFVSSATFSPTKRGVFVGATVDAEMDRLACSVDRGSGSRDAIPSVSVSTCIERNCGNTNPARDDEEDDIAVELTKRYRRWNDYAAAPSISSSQQQSSINKPRFLPSSSFDTKHYNKFNMNDSNPPSPTSMIMDPILRKLELQIKLLGEEAIKSAALAAAQTPPSVRKHGSGKHSHAPAPPPRIAPLSVKSEIHLIRNMLAKFIIKMSERETSKRNAEAWRLISMVLDRVFLFGYILSMILSLTTLFPQRPAELSDGVRFPNGTLIDPSFFIKTTTPSPAVTYQPPNIY